MKNIKTEELENINGGELSMMAIIGIAALVVFLLGIFEGIVNPRKCGAD